MTLSVQHQNHWPRRAFRIGTLLIFALFASCDGGGSSADSGISTAGVGNRSGSGTGANVGVASGWERVGTADFSPGTAKDIDLFVFDGTPYVAYPDGDNGGKATVMKYDGSAWVSVGTPGFSVGFAGNLDGFARISLVVMDSTPYVAYPDEGQLSVMKFDGADWVSVGSSPSTSADTDEVCLIINGRSLAVGYADATTYTASVSTFDGSNWSSLGSSPGWLSQSLVADGGSLWLLYDDYSASRGVNVSRFTGTSWAAVSTSAVRNASTSAERSLAVIDGVPYVAYEDLDQEDAASGSGKLSVVRCDGTSWSNVGPKGFSDGGISYATILAHEGTLYVAYKDRAHNYGATVQRFDGTTWTTLGTPAFTGTSANYDTLFAADGYLYLAFTNHDNGERANVMRYRL